MSRCVGLKLRLLTLSRSGAPTLLAEVLHLVQAVTAMAIVIVTIMVVLVLVLVPGRGRRSSRRCRSSTGSERDMGLHGRLLNTLDLVLISFPISFRSDYITTKMARDSTSCRGKDFAYDELQAPPPIAVSVSHSKHLCQNPKDSR